LKIWTMKDTARFEICFSALFVIQLGVGALPTLKPLMALKSVCWVCVSAVIVLNKQPWDWSE
jgi:hypothetical protein